MKNPGPKVSEREIRALLEEFDCPLPYHQVRTLVLGNIAAPAMQSPFEVFKLIWDGELPAFESESDAQRLLGTLLQGLWNGLAEHQNRRHPFKLRRLKPPADEESLARYGIIRLEEMDGFVEGLFGEDEEINLPERAHDAMRHLSDIRAMLAGLVELMARPGREPTSAEQARSTGRQFVELTRIAEKEINALIQANKRARANQLAELPAFKPSVH